LNALVIICLCVNVSSVCQHNCNYAQLNTSIDKYLKTGNTTGYKAQVTEAGCHVQLLHQRFGLMDYQAAEVLFKMYIGLNSRKKHGRHLNTVNLRCARRNSGKRFGEGEFKSADFSLSESVTSWPCVFQSVFFPGCLDLLEMSYKQMRLLHER
jgi:hypothetical protein